MGSWFRGVCHEVPNGDTLVINATTSSPGPPPQKRIVLASLVAPKMVRQQRLTYSSPSSTVMSLVAG